MARKNRLVVVRGDCHFQYSRDVGLCASAQRGRLLSTPGVQLNTCGLRLVMSLSCVKVQKKCYRLQLH
jgi:hypothetical protein